jgi:PilZ domain-containing protein
VPDERRPDLRRHPRARVAWPVVIEVGVDVCQALTVDVSPFGAKVATTAGPLKPGTLAQLHFHPPEVAPLDIQALVWRTDPDGQAFFFVGGRLAFPTETVESDS